MYDSKDCPDTQSSSSGTSNDVARSVEGLGSSRQYTLGMVIESKSEKSNSVKEGSGGPRGNDALSDIRRRRQPRTNSKNSEGGVLFGNIRNNCEEGKGQMTKPKPNKRSLTKPSKFLLTVFQENYVEGKGKEVIELSKIDLDKNDPKANLKFTKDSFKKSETDGEIYGIIIKRNKENNSMDAWKINPYTNEQNHYGIQVKDPKTGEIRYEGDDGGGWEMLLWEQTPEGDQALKRARQSLGPGYSKMLKRVGAKKKDSKKYVDHFPEDLIDSVEEDFISLAGS